MLTQEDDNTYVSQFIRAIENPDSLGFRDGRWYQYPNKKFDKNNRGFGVDVKHNKAAKELTKNRKGKWLSEEEERNIRQEHIDYIKEKLADKTPMILQQQPSEKKKAMMVGLGYRGDFKNLFKNNPSIRDAYYSGTDDELQNKVSDYYKAHKLSERARLQDTFLQNNSTTDTSNQQFEQNFPMSYEDLEFKPQKVYSYGGPLKDWDTLSLEEKAEMMKVAINNGITTLPEIKKAYNKFAEGGPKDTWTMQDEAGYRAWRESLPKNLRDTKDSDYDMRAAYKAGVKPRWNEYDKKYHLQSRVPESGRILKAPHHPTYLEALAEDASLGYYPTIDSKGNTYTETWEGNTQYPREIEVPYKAYGGNLFGSGGKKTSASSNSSIAMDYLRSKGMNQIAASAIVGTLQAESGLNPAIHAKMKGDSGEGLAQWTGSRKNQFWSTLEKIEPGAKKRYGSIVNVPLERQLDVVMAERPDVTFAINNAKDLHTATDIMLRGYENGGGNINNLASIGQINNIYGKWNNGYDRQFNTRLGYAKNLFGADATPYTISQNALDNINADINNVDLSGLSSNGIPMLGVPTMENQAPYTTSTQPTMAWEKEEKPTAITEFEYTPEQERRDNLRSMSNIFNLMGIENPFMDTFRQVDGYSNNPLMAMANMNI